MVGATTGIALLATCGTLVRGMCVVALVAAGIGGKAIRVDVEAVAALMDVRLAHPLSLAFWYCSHLDSSNLQWERRDWYVSSD